MCEFEIKALKLLCILYIGLKVFIVLTIMHKSFIANSLRFIIADSFKYEL